MDWAYITETSKPVKNATIKNDKRNDSVLNTADQVIGNVKDKVSAPMLPELKKTVHFII